MFESNYQNNSKSFDVIITRTWKLIPSSNTVQKINFIWLRMQKYTASNKNSYEAYFCMHVCSSTFAKIIESVNKILVWWKLNKHLVWLYFVSICVLFSKENFSNALRIMYELY